MSARDRLQDAIFRAWSTFYDSALFQRPFFRRVHEAVLQTAAPDARRVLDLGCGTAQLTVDLAARHPFVAGADLSPEMLRAAKRRLGASAPPLVCANVYALPFADGAFDLLTSTISYHWYADKPRALAEIRRVLAPGGHLLLATITETRIKLGPPKLVRFTDIRETERDLAAAGFTVAARRRVRPFVTIFDARKL